MPTKKVRVLKFESVQAVVDAAAAATAKATNVSAALEGTISVISDDVDSIKIRSIFPAEFEEKSVTTVIGNQEFTIETVSINY